MFEVVERDGAGRLARWEAERGPSFETPSILWIPGELDVVDAAWTPRVGRAQGAVDLVNTFSIQEDQAHVKEVGGLVLRRRLETPSIMAEGANLRQVGRVAVMVNALNLMRNPKRFAPAIVAARKEAGYNQVLYAPGLGEPGDLALLAYCGVDLFDASALSYAAARGLYLTADGARPAASVVDVECPCPACAHAGQMDEAKLRRHNQWAARLELAHVRNAIRAGTLRLLVESRVRADPERTALLRRLDALHDHFEERSPVESSSFVLATSKESIDRPEVVRFRRRVVERHRPAASARILVLLPCSARKPYSRSQSHRRFLDAIWRSGVSSMVEEWIVTSPLGVVPRALERTYPAARYDVPVTGEWDAIEGEMIRGVLGPLMAKREWDAVVAHLPVSTLDLVRPVLPESVEVTVDGGSPTRDDNLSRLTAVLQRVGEPHTRPSLREALAERVRTIADYQFGHAAGDALLAGTVVRGKWPGAKVFDRDEQLASLPLSKGLLSLTLPGSRRLLEAGHALVEIDDFDVKGSVFAVGVRSADPAIRIGDEVVVHHAGKPKGVGVAQMSGPEMAQMERGEAVKVRHHV